MPSGAKQTRRPTVLAARSLPTVGSTCAASHPAGPLGLPRCSRWGGRRGRLVITCTGKYKRPDVQRSYPLHPLYQLSENPPKYFSVEPKLQLPRSIQRACGAFCHCYSRTESTSLRPQCGEARRRRCAPVLNSPPSASRQPPSAIRQPPAAEEPLRSPRQQLPGHPRLRLPPSYAALHTPPKPQRTSWE